MTSLALMMSLYVNDVLNCLKTLRAPRFNLCPKPFALYQFCSNICYNGCLEAKVDPSIVANNKGADQLAHRRSLISAFAIHLLNSIILKLAPSEISLFYLGSVAEKAGFGLSF